MGGGGGEMASSRRAGEKRENGKRETRNEN